MRNVLVVAAHPDDEVLGAGGTIARLADEGAEVHLLILSEGETSRHSNRRAANARRAVRARETAAQKAAKILGAAGISFGRFPDNRFDSVDLLTIVQRIEAEAEEVRPQAVFTHFWGDLNIDHRITCDAVLAAFRPRPEAFGQELYSFEVPSSTGWAGSDLIRAFRPSVYVNIAKYLRRKLEAMAVYTMETQPAPHARSLEAVEALARFRGSEVGLVAAEAFVLQREIRR
jgi:LmbE family N-acetylglucosaminyl deacetylase